MKIAICDDDGKAIDFLKAKIECQGNRDEVRTFFHAGEMTPEKMRGFDLIYLDIEMPGMNGMELADLLRARQEDACVPPYGSLPLLVFVSGYKEYMGRAFSVQAFDFLVKPVSDEAFRKSYERARKAVGQLCEKDAVLTIKSAGNTYSISASGIVYVESQNRKNIIHFNGRETIEYYGAMSDLEKELDNRFFRIHKGYIVNMMYIQKYDRSSVSLSSGEILLMSKYRYQDFAASYMNYLRWKEGKL